MIARKRNELAAKASPSSPPESAPHSGDSDFFADVPATVVCATCGEPDCVGCRDDFSLSLSGIVNVVPWERPGPWTARFWSTARSASFDGESFFERLPEGSLSAAFGFALLAETIAITSFAIVWTSLAVVLLPSDLIAQLGSSKGLVFARYVPLSTLSFVAVLLVAHTLHAIGLAYGAKREGRPLRIGRALRFGFYSTAWDVVMSPFGLVMAILTERLEGAARVRRCLTGLPTRCSIGLLRGVYRLDGPAASRALRVSYVAAIIATLLATGAIVAGAVALALT